MKKSVAAALLFSCVLALFAVRDYIQAQQSQDYQAMTDKFFTLLSKGKSDEAIDFMFSTNPALMKLTDQSERLKNRFNELNAAIGGYGSNYKLLELKVADRFVYQHFFVAYDLQPISVRIKYYKPGSKWMVYGVQFDTDLTDAIQKQGDEGLFKNTK